MLCRSAVTSLTTRATAVAHANAVGQAIVFGGLPGSSTVRRGLPTIVGDGERGHNRVWSFQVEENGSLTNAEAFYH